MPVVINLGTILRHSPWVRAKMCIKILLAIRFRGIGHGVLRLVSSTVIRYYALHNNGRQPRQFTFAWCLHLFCFPDSKLLWRFNVARNNKTYLSMHAKCPMFMPNFNQLSISPTNFHKSYKYQISWVYVLWGPCWYMRTEGRT